MLAGLSRFSLSRRSLSHKYSPSAFLFSHNLFTSTMGGKSSSDSVAFVDDAIKSNQVTVFSKSYCPYCVKTKKTLAGLQGVEVKTFELDEMEDGDAIQRALADLTGQRTVPNVFVGGQHLGGNDDTQRAFQTGKIHEMLA